MAVDRGLPRQGLLELAKGARLTLSDNSAQERAIYLTNFARPFNMARQIEAARAVRPPVDIVLIDNSGPPSNLPALDLKDVEVVRPGVNRGGGYRFELAARSGYRAVLCLDDDIFLTPAQIESLFERQAQEPDRVHGVWGEDISRLPFGLGFRTHLCRRNREVDILNRLYLLTPAQARQTMSLAERLGFSAWSEIGLCEDVLLSFACPRKPACHDLGPIEECQSSDQAGIASWRRSGFYAYRSAVIKRIRRLRDATGALTGARFCIRMLFTFCLLLAA